MQAMLMPRTWWQHLKLALRDRWPRMFGRLIVQWAPARKVDVGALRAGARDVEAVGFHPHLRVVKGDD